MNHGTQKIFTNGTFTSKTGMNEVKTAAESRTHEVVQNKHRGKQDTVLENILAFACRSEGLRVM